METKILCTTVYHELNLVRSIFTVILICCAFIQAIAYISVSSSITSIEVVCVISIATTIEIVHIRAPLTFVYLLNEEITPVNSNTLWILMILEPLCYHLFLCVCQRLWNVYIETPSVTISVNTTHANKFSISIEGNNLLVIESPIYIGINLTTNKFLKSSLVLLILCLWSHFLVTYATCESKGYKTHQK